MKTVFVDIDTQWDFLFPAGALYVPHAEKRLPHLRQLREFAESRGITVLSTADAHLEDDPEFRTWPHHCVAGTLGQRKPAELLSRSPIIVPVTPLPTQGLNAPQIILEKQSLRFFTNPNTADLLTSLSADCYVVYGVATEYCVGLGALDLLGTGKRVEIVTDAIEGIAAVDIEAMLVRLTSAGARLTTVSEVCA